MYKICRTEKSLARQRELENGFLDYIENVSFFDTEVASLCRYLNIPRKTFYRYFGSQEDALHALIDHRLADMNACIRAQSAEREVTLHNAITAFFTFWKNEHRFLDILTQNYLAGVLMVRAVSQNPDSTSSLLYAEPERESADSYILNFLISGIMSMMFQWHSGGYQTSIEELTSIVEQLYSQPIRAILNYPE